MGACPGGSVAPWCLGSVQDPWVTQRGWERGLVRRQGWGTEMCPRSLQGWVLLKSSWVQGFAALCPLLSLPRWVA